MNADESSVWINQDKNILEVLSEVSASRSKQNKSLQLFAQIPQPLITHPAGSVTEPVLDIWLVRDSWY